MPDRRIYLDNAATSWPKPEAVYAAMDQYHRALGAPAGRSGYREAAEVERQLQDCRNRLARLLGANEPRRIIFTTSGTSGLNLALHGLLGPGDHVVTTAAEHNSVLRPLRHLETQRHVEVTRARCDPAGVVSLNAVRAALRPNTKLIAVTHASNVTGMIQPVAEIGELARRYGALLLVDAAQTAGHLAIDVNGLGIDLLAAPGHKGLLGPLGTGILYVGPGVEERLESTVQGGTGTRSEHDRQPATLPEKYEAGNLNVPGLIGLGAGVAHLEEQGLEQLRRHDLELTQRFLHRLRGLTGIEVYARRSAEAGVSVVSLNVAGYDPQEVAGMLDATHRVQVRAGLHCAPLMHAELGTLKTGGTVRFSFGPFNSPEDVDAAGDALAEMAAAASGLALPRG